MIPIKSVVMVALEEGEKWYQGKVRSNFNHIYSTLFQRNKDEIHQQRTRDSRAFVSSRWWVSRSCIIIHTFLFLFFHNW